MVKSCEMTSLEFLLARITEDEQRVDDLLALADDIEAGYSTWKTAPTSEVQAVAALITAACRLQAECGAKRRIIGLHESWPTLIQKPMEVQLEARSGVDAYADAYSIHVSQQIAWLTTQEYVARFGVEPPTAPILSALISIYSDHQDYPLARP